MREIISYNANTSVFLALVNHEEIFEDGRNTAIVNSLRQPRSLGQSHREMLVSSGTSNRGFDRDLKILILAD